MQQLHCLTIVSEQRLRRTLALWTGGLCAASAVEADAAVGATVTLASQRRVASIYTPLETGSGQLIVRLGVTNVTEGEDRSLTVSVCAPMASNSAES